MRTGLRRSEICGLNWDSVDLEAGSLSVVATLQQIRGHGLVTGTPKTKSSRRTVTLAPETIDLARQVQGTQTLQRIEYGPLWQDTGTFSLGPTGPPLPLTV
ncbi:MAG: hypothetical protein IIA92_04505 [Chloroflexi bacterium]|nr:hypothetical protein [Chloroflexota bacterium]